MCGIVGYVGTREAIPLLLHGLKALEYRGYDSAGIAVISKNDGGEKIWSVKCPGRFEMFEARVYSAPLPSAHICIAHTRWATHGEPNEINAHPHFDCAHHIAVVHNGIIENFQELKKELIAAGHVFVSATDTEVLPHLIEEEQKRGGEDDELLQAVLRALHKIRGTYGIAVLDTRAPTQIIAARNFSPLLIGVGDREWIVASDAAAVLRHTQNIIYLEEGEVAVLTPQGYRIVDLHNNTVLRKPEHVLWTEESAQKNGYPHFMLKEIFEQPEGIENSLRGRCIAEEGRVQLGGLREANNTLRATERILITACGTAFHAGKLGEYMIEEYAGIPVEVDIASEFRYRKPVFRPHDVLLAISQSGETADTLAAVREAKGKNVTTLGIVNVVGSSLARETIAGVYQHIGPEVSVASTKAFTSQSAILALLTVLLGREREMSLITGKRIIEELKKIPDYMRAILEQSEKIHALAKKFAVYDHFFFLGRKYNIATAYEGALKLKEISYIHAEGLGAGEMKHGPIAMIDAHMPTICIAPLDSVYEKMRSNIEELKARRGPVIAITTEGNVAMEELADATVMIPKTLEMLTPLLAIVPLQLFAYYCAVERGCNVDRPKNLAKSVTVE